MALREEFKSAGQWLFRWRSFLPLLMFGMIIAAMRDFEYPGHSKQLDALWEAVCLLVSFGGLSIRAYTIGHVPRNTSGRNTREQKADTLNTTGIYSVVRHPLYLGNFFMGLGFVMLPHSWELILIYVLAFCVYYERIMFVEEEYLRDKFSDEFLEWAARTPAFIPKFTYWKQPSLPFSLRHVLKREYNGFLAVIVVFFILEVVGDIFVRGKFELDLMWVILLIFGFVVWMVLRTLRKRSKLLIVDGR